MMWKMNKNINIIMKIWNNESNVIIMMKIMKW